MIRMLPASMACVLMLAGCAAASRPAAPQHYALIGPTPAATSAPAIGRVASRPTLRIARIVAPAWLEGTGLYYRLDYRNRNRLAAYSASDWVAPPMQMLEQLIQNTLFASGEWAAVVGPSDPARAGYSMHIRINDFSQAFASPDRSDAVIDATVTLVDDADNNTLAQRRFHFRVPAPSANAAGGVAALDEAGRQLAASLQRWAMASIARSPASAATPITR